MKINKTYIINLERRPDRKISILKRIKKFNLELNEKIYKAVDGYDINENYLHNNNIKLLNIWKEPYKGTIMSLGEIGCALSHYFIWKDIVDKSHKGALIIEDDANFSNNFKTVLDEIILPDNYDILYLGRQLFKKHKYEINISNYIYKPIFSFWAIGYYITYNGAKKLLNSGYLQNLIPVDEFLPIMYNEPNSRFKNDNIPKIFENVNKLNAFAIKPNIIFPSTNAFSDSDTENSNYIYNIFKNITEYNSKITVISIATDETDGYKRFIRSLKIYCKYN